MPTMTVSFPGGKRVDAHYGGFTIRTDQSPKGGGEGSAPQPFDLFLASIATCAGIYVKGYCDARGLSTEGLGLTMHIEHDHIRAVPLHGGHRIGCRLCLRHHQVGVAERPSEGVANRRLVVHDK